MKRLRATLRSRRGFMLAEALAALTFFAIMITGLVPVLISATRGIDQGKRTTGASTIARDKIEEIRNTAFAAVATGSDTVADALTGASYTRSWTVTAGPAAATKVVTVTVDWSQRASHQVSLTTVIAE